MMQSSDSSFLRKYLPLVLIAIGSFFLLFPFGLIGGEYAFYVTGIIGFATLVLGVIIYYQKRTSYSASLRKKMKILGMLFLASVAAIPVVGVGMGVSIVLFPPSYENTKDLDTELFEKKILDWVNTDRYKNNVGGVNLDDTLTRLAEIRSAELIDASPEDIQKIGDVDANIVAKREGIQCMIDGEPSEIYDYIIFMPHNNYPDIDKLTDFLLMQLANDKVQREVIFAPDVTKTGIDTVVTKDSLIVVQNFC